MSVEPAPLRVFQDAGKRDLDRYFALGKRIAPQVDGRRCSMADFAEQFVFADLFHWPGACSGGLAATGAGNCGQDLLRRGAADVPAGGQRAVDGKHRKDIVAKQR